MPNLCLLCGRAESAEGFCRNPPENLSFGKKTRIRIESSRAEFQGKANHQVGMLARDHCSVIRCPAVRLHREDRPLEFKLEPASGFAFQIVGSLVYDLR